MAGATTQSNNTSNTTITSSNSSTGGVATNEGFAYEDQTVPNALHYFSSYTYNLSLSVLDIDSFNNVTYRKSGPAGPFLAYSANQEPNNRVNTVFGKFDFFIEDLRINHLAGFDQATGNTNAAGFSFKIIEPYSMGLFFVALQQSAKEKGHDNYLMAPLLLTLEFKGHLSATPQYEIQNFTWPNLKRYYTIRLRLADIRVGPNGCEYDITAIPYNEQALEQSKVILQTPVSINGSTVEEILKTNPKKSFEVYINTKEKNQVEQAQVKKVPDVYEIEFPLGPNGEPNPIKDSSLGFDLYSGTTTPFAEENFSFENGVYKRGNISVDPSKSEFTFAQGTDIVNLINQVIFMSDYGRNSLKNVSKDGFVNWWRIETDMKVIPSKENIPYTGVTPFKFTYRIVPYRASASHFLPPNEKLQGTELDKKLVVKKYDYIYSGNNVDVINFDINFKQGFYVAINADGSLNSLDKKLSDSSGTIINPSDFNGSQSGKGQAEIGTDALPTRMEPSRLTNERKGGNRFDDAASLAAKQFHEALTSGKDMVNTEITILGDPYYLSDSGLGNYHAGQTTNLYVNSDGAMNWDRTEIHILVNFKTPVDIDLKTGLYDFSKLYTAPQFSGLYKVTMGESIFSKGKFIQKLKILRLKGQEAVAGSGTLAVSSEELRTPEELAYTASLGDFAG